LGGTLYYRGELLAARAHLEQGLVLYRPEEHRADAVRSDQDPGLACIRHAALTLWSLGFPDQAPQRSQQALAVAQASRHPPSLAAALVFAARVHQHRGEGPLARERAEATMPFAREQGFTQCLAAATILRGWALAAQGQVDDGIAEMQEGLTAFRTTGARDDLPYWLALLAEGHGRGGQAAEGLHVASEALAIAHTQGLHVWEAELHRLQGELRLLQAARKEIARSQSAEAEAALSFQEAIEIARQQQAKALELRAAIHLSRLWHGQGQRAQARQLVAAIYSWFTEGHDTADLQEARAFLGE
jgi:predicted ATPase